MISAVIAAYNEAENIGKIIDRTKNFVDEIIVVDDASSDETSSIATQKGAKVIENSKNSGQLVSLKRGIQEASGDMLFNFTMCLRNF